MSDKPPRRYLVEDYATSIVSFLDALKIKKTNVVGDNTGSTLSVELAATRPDRVDKLVLCGNSFYTPEERQGRLKNPQYFPMEITEDGSFLLKQWNYKLEGIINRDLRIALKIVVANMQAGLDLHAAHDAVWLYHKEPKLPLIKSPTLVMAGSDGLFYDRLEPVRNLIPKCRIKIIEGAGNVPTLEKPNEFAQAILEFLKNPLV